MKIQITHNGGQSWTQADIRRKPTITEVLESPCTHTYLKQALQVFLQKDPIDASNDAELLAELMRQRVENYL